MKNLIFALLISSAAFAGCRKCHESPVNGCIDEKAINKNSICTQEYDPVCGCDGKTYGNECTARNAGVTSWTKGECGNKTK